MSLELVITAEHVTTSEWSISARPISISDQRVRTLGNERPMQSSFIVLHTRSLAPLPSISIVH